MGSRFVRHATMLAPGPDPNRLLDSFVGAYKMLRMTERLRGLVQGVGSREIRIGAAILLLMLFLLVLFWLVVMRFSGQETAEQETSEEGTTVVPESRHEDFPLIFDPGPSSAAAAEPARAASATDEGEGERGIPGLSDMDVIGELQYVPGTDFRCPGGGPAGGGLNKRTCISRTADSPTIYEVALVEDDPRTVLSVTVTARDASDEEAAAVLGYVARLSIGTAGPMDPEAWVGRSISSGGGQYFSNGAEVRVYGTEGARTLEIVAAPTPTDQGPQTTNGSPETTNEPPR